MTAVDGSHGNSKALSGPLTVGAQSGPTADGVAGPSIAGQHGQETPAAPSVPSFDLPSNGLPEYQAFGFEDGDTVAGINGSLGALPSPTYGRGVL